MAASTCFKCGGRRWVRYFSETTDGNFEEAFRLCPCNHEPEIRHKHTREEPRCPETAPEELTSTLDQGI